MKKNVYLVMTDFDDYYAFNDHDNAFEKAHSLLDCNGTNVSVREVEIEDADEEEDHAPVEASLPETEEQDDEDEKDDEEVDAVQVLADLLNFVNFLHWLQDEEEK